jgi:pimeloyl-ACP methyl ester carboxylesterase
MAVSEEFVEVDGCRVRIAKDGKGPPLLYLHGANGPNLWTEFFDELAKRFTVMAPDHPSYGKSGEPEWLEDIGDLAYFYLDFIKQLGLKRVHLVGHSMGGWLAMEIAVRATDRLASLTLIAPAGIRVKGHPAADLFIDPPETIVPLVYVDPKLREAALAEIKRPKSPEEIDNLIRNRVSSARLCWSPRLFNPKLAKWLHRIDVPTHLMWGDTDKVIPTAHAEELKKLSSRPAVTRRRSRNARPRSTRSRAS